MVASEPTRGPVGVSGGARGGAAFCFAVALGSYVTLAVVMTWPLVAEMDRALPVGSDNLYVAWSLAWICHALVTSPARLFDANIFHPVRHSLAFSDPNVSSAVLVAPLYLATGNPALGLNVLFLASFVLCGLAAWLVARDWGATEAAAVAAGVFFAFSPWRLGHIDHLQLYAFWWTPLALFGLRRYLRSAAPRYAWLTAASLLGQLYTSIYLFVFQLTALALLLFFELRRGNDRPALRRLGVGAAPGLVAVVVLALPLGLAYFSASRTWGMTRSLAENARYSASPSAFLSVTPANLVWGRVLERFADPVAPWEKYLFPGAVPLALAMIGAWRQSRSLLSRYGLLLFIAAALLSLGPFLELGGRSWRTPYGWLFPWFPPLQALRGPARWGLLGTFGLSLAAAAGVARLGRPMLVVALLAALAEASVWPLPLDPLPHGGEPPAVYRFLAHSEDRGAVLEIPLAEPALERYQVEPARMYWSTTHWRPLANGYSGYTPAPYGELAKLLETGPSPPVLRFLAAWGLTTVVVHLDEIDAAARTAWSGSLAAADEVFRDEATRVVRITAAPQPFAAIQAGLAQPATLVTRMRQSLALAFDSSADPQPVDPDQIGWHTLRARWIDSSGRSSNGWARLYCPPAIPSRLAPQPLFLEPPAAAGSYRLEITAGCFEFAARVVIERLGR
jgi:hypothetical protein